MGEDVQLRPRAAQVLGLVFHELTTSAAKYGALTVLDGRITVRSSSERSGQRPRLRIVWAERGGPAVTRPKRRGSPAR